MGDLAESPMDSSNRLTLNVRLPTTLAGGDGELGDVQHAPAWGRVLAPGEAAATRTAAGQLTGRGHTAQRVPSSTPAEGTGWAEDSVGVAGGQPRGDGTPGQDKAEGPTADVASHGQGREDYVLAVRAAHCCLLLPSRKYISTSVL